LSTPTSLNKKRMSIIMMRVRRCSFLCVSCFVSHAPSVRAAAMVTNPKPMAMNLADGRGDLAETVQVDTNKLKDELEARIDENKANFDRKKRVEAASLVAGTTQLTDVVEEAIPLEVPPSMERWPHVTEEAENVKGILTKALEELAAENEGMKPLKPSTEEIDPHALDDMRYLSMEKQTMAKDFRQGLRQIREVEARSSLIQIIREDRDVMPASPTTPDRKRNANEAAKEEHEDRGNKQIHPWSEDTTTCVEHLNETLVSLREENVRRKQLRTYHPLWDNEKGTWGTHLRESHIKGESACNPTAEAIAVDLGTEYEYLPIELQIRASITLKRMIALWQSNPKRIAAELARIPEDVEARSSGYGGFGADAPSESPARSSVGPPREARTGLADRVGDGTLLDRGFVEVVPPAGSWDPEEVRWGRKNAEGMNRVEFMMEKLGRPHVRFEDRPKAVQREITKCLARSSPTYRPDPRDRGVGPRDDEDELAARGENVWADADSEGESPNAPGSVFNLTPPMGEDF
jgi:hypothetical protein